ncbi:MAG: hypothetical protein GW949_03790 [Spirochaetales bacterium]|nr:hypothetical protein [Spirochaetales bacterium]
MRTFLRSISLFGLLLIFLAGCATGPEPTEELNRQILTMEDEHRQAQATWEAEKAALEEELAATLLVVEQSQSQAAQLSGQVTDVSDQLSQAQRQRDTALARVRELEVLLRDLSFATSLAPAATSTTAPTGTSTPSIPTPASDSAIGTSPLETLTPQSVAQAQAALLTAPAYETRATVFPVQLADRTERTFIAGSTALGEIDQELRTQFIYDRRAYYGTSVHLYSEIRRPLNGSALDFWVYFQVVTEPQAASPGLESVEYTTTANGRRTLTDPGTQELLQDPERKVDRIGFSLSQAGVRDFIEWISTESRPALVLQGSGGRVRITLTEIERAALLEMVRSYRELGGRV